MKCILCNGTGEFDYKHMQDVRVYGMSLAEIHRMWQFAQEHGYKEKEANE